MTDSLVCSICLELLDCEKDPEEDLCLDAQHVFCEACRIKKGLISSDRLPPSSVVPPNQPPGGFVDNLPLVGNWNGPQAVATPV